MRWNYSTDAWIGIIVLAIKAAATLEASANRLRDYVWLFYGGVAVAFCAVAWGFREQHNLLHPVLVHAKHIGQVILAGIILPVALFRTAYDRQADPFIGRHCWIMTLLWFDYAIVGLIAPAKLHGWVALNDPWTAVACVAMVFWILLTSATLRAKKPASPAS